VHEEVDVENAIKTNNIKPAWRFAYIVAVVEVRVRVKHFQLQQGLELNADWNRGQVQPARLCFGVGSMLVVLRPVLSLVLAIAVERLQVAERRPILMLRLVRLLKRGVLLSLLSQYCVGRGWWMM